MSGLWVVFVLVCGCVLSFGPLALKRLFESRARRWAVRQHRRGMTHGQIAEVLGRSPQQIVEWLVADDADRDREGC